MNGLTNDKVIRLAQCTSLEALSPALAEADRELAQQIERHNAMLEQAAAGLRAVRDARRALADFESWRDRSGADLLAERMRLQQRIWDALRDLGRALVKRDVLLKRLLEHWAEQYRLRDEAYDRAVTAAERKLSGIRRKLRASVPASAERHFAELVESEPSVRAAQAHLAAAEQVFNSLTEAQRALVHDLREAQTRQRELFAELVG